MLSREYIPSRGMRAQSFVAKVVRETRSYFGRVGTARYGVDKMSGHLERETENIG
ncbi:hypothetical protein IWX62_003239 [Arthrobacter sp. CAN_A1]